MEEFVSVDAKWALSIFKKAGDCEYAIAGRFICVQFADEELAALSRHYFSVN